MESPQSLDKPALRAWARDRRDGLDNEALTWVLVRRLVEQPEFAAARNVLLYLAMPGEVRVEEVLTREEARGKQWYAPRCAPGRRLAVHPYVPGKTPLRAGPFGIREPDPALVAEESPGTLDLVLVPGLLFSEQGDRLGYGGGYYDRFLPRIAPGCVTVALVPDPLVLPTLPADAWDVPIRLVLTPSKAHRRAGTTVPTPPPGSG